MATTPQLRASRLKLNLPHSGRSAALAYGCAIASVVLTLLVRVLLTPYIGSQYPFATVYFAVTLTAWYGGMYPALFASALGYFGVAYFVTTPHHSLAPDGVSGYIGAGMYFFLSLTAALFSEAQHKAQARAEASALEARRHEAAARESNAQSGALLETALDGIVIMDHSGCIVEFNPCAERMFGLQRSAVLGKEMAELIIPAPLREDHRRGLARYLATGEGSALGRRIEITALGPDGNEFPVELAICRIPGDGPPLFSGQIHDITARTKLERQQRFLAEASDLLASSLDYQTTLQSVARLAASRLADWCVVDMREESGAMRRVAVSHADPAKVALAHELDRRYPPDPNFPSGAPQVIRTGEAELVEEIPDEVLRATTQDEEHYQIVKALGLKSYICVPLAARGRTLGAITFIGAESGHRYGPEDLALALELARRAATAVDNALLYHAERERSEQLTLAIREVHHRVKNNLQAVSALLELQIDEAGTMLPVEAVQDSLQQIKTIALVHDLLTHDQPMGNVDATQVLDKLLKMLSATMGTPEDPLPIRLDSVPLQLPVRAATSLALIVNELVNNTAKHSNRSSSEDANYHGASIQVCLQHQQEEVLVSVQDNGPGFPPGFDPILNAHLGLELVQTLVRSDLQGSISFQNGAAPNGEETASEEQRGARVEITFRPGSLSD